MGLAVLVALAAGAFLLLPEEEDAYPTAEQVVLLGMIGIWRWSVATAHLLRAMWFLAVASPKRRRLARLHGGQPPILYAIVPSYRMSSKANLVVYRSFLRDAACLRRPVRIFALITDPADAAVLERAFAAFAHELPEGSSLVPLFQDGTGKRAAMAQAVRLIARENPPPDAQVALMDGDSVVLPGLLDAASRYLDAFPSLGAVTTDNDVAVAGHWITREWYRLRMAQRHVLMASMALSRRVLVLTGRFSLFRWQAMATPEFALALERDAVDIGRFGRIAMVTGDDKTTWFQLLKRGWRTDYLPHVGVVCLERLPEGGWLRATTALMWRWYGNMVRNTGRAIGLGWRRVGLFPWLVLVDQRVSPWTTLLGPIVAATLAWAERPAILPLYLLWVLLSRSLVCVVLGALGGRAHTIQPVLLYYTQVWGALIKVMVIAAPHRQKWTRQATRRPGQSQTSLDLLGKIWIATAAMTLLLGTILIFRLHLDRMPG